jgi:hypothetical protein
MSTVTPGNKNTIDFTAAERVSIVCALQARIEFLNKSIFHAEDDDEREFFSLRRDASVSALKKMRGAA